MPMYGFLITSAGRVCCRRRTKYSCECRCAYLLSRDHAVAAGLVSALLNIAANADVRICYHAVVGRGIYVLCSLRPAVICMTNIVERRLLIMATDYVAQLVELKQGKTVL
jgi:hypothetical protein